MRAWLQNHPAQCSGILLIALLLLASAGKGILFDTLDPDLFWHLRVAAQLQTDGIGPIVDRISYNSIREPWTPYSWLAELFMHAIWTSGGFRLAVGVQAIAVAGLITLITCSVMQAAWRVKAEASATTDPIPWLAITVSGFAGAFLSLPYLSFRPVLFALVLIAAINMLCWRDRRLGYSTRTIWCVLPLLVITTNLHLFAAIGALLVGLHALGSPRFDRRCIMLMVGAILATCCTPMLPGLIRTAWHYQQTDPMVAGGKIVEMLPFWTGPLGAASAVVALLMLLSVARSWRSMTTFDWIAIVIACALLLRLGRFAPMFAIIVSPYVARSLGGLLRDTALATPIVRWALSTTLAIGLVRVCIAFPWTASLDEHLNRHAPPQEGYPAAAAMYVEANITPNTGRLINEFTWGGYLSWRLGDQFQVMLDGRTQLYTPAFWQRVYFDDVSARRSALAEADADAAILPAGKSVFRDDLLQAGWRISHDDGVAQVLLPPSSHVQTPPD